MSTKISTYVNRFQTALATEKKSHIDRIRAVDGLLTEHSMKAGDASRAIWSLDADVKLTSAHTSPVSHAKTVSTVIASFGFTVADTDSDTSAAIATAFKIATGKVTAAKRDAAISKATSLAAFTLTADSATRYAALLAVVTALLAPAKRGAKVPAPKVELTDTDETVTKGAAIVVTTPANITEVLATLDTMLTAIPFADRGPWLAKVAAMVNRQRTAHTAPVSPVSAKNRAKRTAKVAA